MKSKQENAVKLDYFYSISVFLHFSHKSSVLYFVNYFPLKSTFAGC